MYSINGNEKLRIKKMYSINGNENEGLEDSASQLSRITRELKDLSRFAVKSLSDLSNRRDKLLADRERLLADIERRNQGPRQKAETNKAATARRSQMIVGASQGVHPPRGEQSSFYPPQANVEPQGHTVRIHCEANPEFFLAARGDVAVLALENLQDPHQQWIKVSSWGLQVKHEAGFPAFALVNKATRHALKHGDKEWDQIYLADYNHDKAEQSVLWTLSADVGNGYQCLRPVNNINLNMDAKAADGHVGGIRDGNELILFEWKKQSNQKWKLQPIH